VRRLNTQRCRQRSSGCRCVTQRMLRALQTVLSGCSFQLSSHAGNVPSQTAMSTADTAASRAADTAAVAISALQAQLSAQSAVLLVSAQLVDDLTDVIHDISVPGRQDPQQHHEADDCTAIAGLVHLSPAEVQDLLCPPPQAVTDCHSGSKASALLRGVLKHGTQGDSLDDLNTVRHRLQEDAEAALVELETIRQHLDRWQTFSNILQRHTGRYRAISKPVYGL